MAGWGQAGCALALLTAVVGCQGAAPDGDLDLALSMADFDGTSAIVVRPRSGVTGGPRALEARGGPRRWAVVLVDVSGGGVDVTPAALAARLFDPDDPSSLRSAYREISYGAEDLEGEVFGPLSYRFRPGRECDIEGLVAALAPRLAAPGAFDQFLYYFGARQPGCKWTGLADLGSVVSPASVSYYNAAQSCVVFMQETGHNVGMVHSSAVHCVQDGTSTTAVPLAATAAGVCVHEEYGNPFDPMGTGCFHMNGFQKAYRGWLRGCNVVKAERSGTYTLHALETSCDGLQLLQVPMARPRLVTLGDATSNLTSYYVELRAPRGLDRALGTRVLIMVAGDIRDRRRVGGRNWLLDMAPETPTMLDAALEVGRTFSDPEPGGPLITVLSADATTAVIRVDRGDGADPAQPGSGTCRDGTAFAAPGPPSCATTLATPSGAAPAFEEGPPQAGASADAGDGWHERAAAGYAPVVQGVGCALGRGKTSPAGALPAVLPLLWWLRRRAAGRSGWSMRR